MTTALLLIDVQRNMVEAPDPVADAPTVGEAVADLLARARAAGTLVVHVRNNGTAGDPDLPDTPGWELVHEPRPDEPVVDKTACDSFAGTELAGLLPASADLVLAGMQTDWCVSATARAALARGHRVVLAGGAHSTYPDDRSAAEIIASVEQELAGLGVRVVPAGEIRFDQPAEPSRDPA